jgi:hypothetical protein
MKNKQKAITHSTFPYGSVISIRDRHLPVPNYPYLLCTDAEMPDLIRSCLAETLHNRGGGRIGR